MDAILPILNNPICKDTGAMSARVSPQRPRQGLPHRTSTVLSCVLSCGCVKYTELQACRNAVHLDAPFACRRSERWAPTADSTINGDGASDRGNEGDGGDSSGT